MKHILSSLTCAIALAALSAGPTFAAAAKRQQATNGPVAKLSSAAAKNTRAKRSTTQKRRAQRLISLPALATLRQPAAPLPASLPTTPQMVKLRGIVLMPTGRPQPGASVYVAGAPRQLVITDAQGAFALPVPAGVAVSLRIEYFGEGSSRVEVPTPTTNVLHITLGQ